ncbi:hypothetical protein JTE90_026117 [Oedothorax gibbosus]|uniref:Uncharacterized protein n=1 Tax=Oedothorax gibbosus TaxID=931172 RepID=A0AAV6UZZ0_9ARAC|nr:hypothetical protein JTE90_026117 [Oedothorax gibbosus]
MKRQSTGIRRANEESPQIQNNETKRLKVFHQSESNSNADMEAGSGSDTTEECINVNINGQDEGLQNNTQDAFSNNHSSENNLSEQPYTNGNNSLNINNTVNNMNGSHGEVYLPKEIFSHENIDTSDNLNDSSLGVEEVASSFVVEPAKHCEDERSITPPMPSLSQEPPSQTTDGNPNIAGVDVQTCNNVEESHGSSAGAASPLDQPIQPEKVCVEANDRAEPFHSSQEANKEEVDGASLPASKGRVDVENITLCELKVTRLEGHADVVFSVAADEDFILSSSGDTTVKVWDVEQRLEVSNFAGHSAAVTSVILLNAEQSEILGTKLNCPQTSRIAVSASYDCHIRLWSVLDGHEIFSVYTFNSITCMGFLEEFMYVVVGTEGGKLEVWDLHSAKLVHFVYAHDSSISHLEVRDCYIFSTSKDGAVKVWLLDEGELQPLYARRRRETSVSAPHFGPAQWQAVTVHNDVLYLGDNTCRMKALDWRLGRLRLFVNQPDDQGSCEAVLAKNNILLSTFYNPTTDTGGINVWRLPELTYVGTLTGDLQEICCLSLVQSQEKLRIISGGHQLIVWDFDFSKPPIKTAQDPFFVCEVERVGLQVNDESAELAARKHLSGSTDSVDSSENKKSWCNIS